MFVLLLGLLWSGVVLAGDLDAAPVPSPGKVTDASPHYDLELLYAAGQFDEGLATARERLAAHPDDADLYWHVARFLFEIGERYQRDDTAFDKVALYREMIEVCERGLERHPGHPHLLFGLGVAKARLATTRGVLASVFMASEVEQTWLAVVDSGYAYDSLEGAETLPCDAHLTLGVFYRLVPDWWIMQLLAGTRGDLDKSLQHLQAADACSPGDIGITKELGVTTTCLGVERDDPELLEQGRASLERVLAFEPRHPTDSIDIQHARMLIDDPSLACEYSRDGQQEHDRRHLAEHDAR